MDFQESHIIPHDNSPPTMYIFTVTSKKYFYKMQMRTKPINHFHTFHSFIHSFYSWIYCCVHVYIYLVATEVVKKRTWRSLYVTATHRKRIIRLMLFSDVVVTWFPRFLSVWNGRLQPISLQTRIHHLYT